jgi:sugar phosphate permease
LGTPAFVSIFVPWAPLQEKTFLLSLGFLGGNIGSIIGLPLSSFLCINGFDGGWPSIFYVFGIFGIIWIIVFLLIASDSPSTHRFISTHEKIFIESNVDKIKSTKSLSNAPWLKLLTSKSCIAIYFSGFSVNFIGYMLLTSMPTYMKEVLNFDIKEVIKKSIIVLSFVIF